jgi:hypothetical protein
LSVFVYPPVLKTLRIRGFTYNTPRPEEVVPAKDILWATPEEQLPGVLDALDIPAEDWSNWEASADAKVDPEGKKLAIGRIGEATWDTLDTRVHHFLATALLQLAQQDHAPQLDYAPISLEVVKALEVELGAVFAKYRDSLDGAVPTHDTEEREEVNLAKKRRLMRNHLHSVACHTSSVLQNMVLQIYWFRYSRTCNL